MGATLQAIAVAAACRRDSSIVFDAHSFLNDTEAALETHETDDFREACRQIRRLLDLEIPPATVGDVLGCDVSAIGSVPAAPYSFLKYPDGFEEAVTYAVKIGGDTDTIAAMCGAISGAYLGASNLPDTWLSAVENGPQGADRLFIVWQSS